MHNHYIQTILLSPKNLISYLDMHNCTMTSRSNVDILTEPSLLRPQPGQLGFNDTFKTYTAYTARDHSFPQHMEFWAEPRYLLFCRGNDPRCRI